MDENVKRDLLKEEYLHLQNVIESFDGRTLTIKAWSITASLGGLSAAFVSHSPAILIVSAISSLLFWVIEGFWKTFQYGYYNRSGNLEKYFAGKSIEIYPMQIGGEWYAHWKKGGTKRLLRIMHWPWVALPHVFVFLSGIVLYILVSLDVIKI